MNDWRREDAPEGVERLAGAGAAGAPQPPRDEPVAPEAAGGAVPRPPDRRGRGRAIAWAAGAGALAALVAAGVVALASNGTWYEAQWVSQPAETAAAAEPSTAVTALAVTSAAAAPPAEGPPAVLPAAFADLAPRGVYLTVDTWANRLRVYRGGTLLREAVCSTGSRTVLKDPVGGRTWVFDTPLGERRVERKVRNPVWIKPDWAFVEQGFLPPKDFRQRVDDVSLGDYGLYLGDGYIIHGTLFQSLLGRPLTHGCIRLGDEDLEYVYRTTPVGARVYLY